MANFFKLREMRNELMKKNSKTVSEEEVLKELIALGNILDKSTHSLSLSDDVCHTCGRKIE